MASTSTEKHSSLCPEYKGRVNYMSTLSSGSSIFSEAKQSNTTGAAASKTTKQSGSFKTQQSTRASTTQDFSSQPSLRSRIAISQRIVSSQNQQKSCTSNSRNSEGIRSKSMSKSSTGQVSYSVATFDTISSSNCNDSAEDIQIASEGGETVSEWPLVGISAYATSSSLKCCAQGEQVRTNNDVRLKIANTAKYLCKSDNKARELQERNEKLIYDLNQVQDQIGTNRTKKQYVSQENIAATEGLKFLAYEEGRVKKKAQRLQKTLTKSEQQVSQLEQQIKFNGEEILAAANSNNQKIARCHSNIKNLMVLKVPNQKAVKKADGDMRCSSKVLRQCSLALDNTLAQLENVKKQLPELHSEIAITRQVCEEKQRYVKSLRANNQRARSVHAERVQETDSNRRRAETLQEAMKTPVCEVGQLQEAVEELRLQQVEADKAVGEKQRRLVELTARLESTEARWNQAVRELSQANMAYNSLLGEVAC